MKKTLILLSLIASFQLQAQKEGAGTLITDGENTTSNQNTPCLSESPNSDKATPITVCNKNTIDITAFGNAGSAKNEIILFNSELKETHTTWLQYRVSSPGNMAFTIFPKNPNDDIDFVLYQLNDLGQWGIIRAATNGPMLGGEKPIFHKGNTTGLQQGDFDFFTGDGSGNSNTEFSDQDGFVAAVNANLGERYLIAINNFTACDGFSLKWQGDFEMDNCGIGTNIGSKVQNSSQIEVSEAFPNPSEEYINLDIYIPGDQANEDQVCPIYLIDILGRVQSQQNIPLSKGGKRIGFNTQDLTKGIYHLQTIIGGKRYIRKFLVN